MIKIMVVGLDGAGSELLFGDERLTNLRRLMEFGCYGRFEGSRFSPRVPSWLYMAASQEPGTADDTISIPGPTIWDQVATQGKQAILMGVSPPYDEPVAIHSGREEHQLPYPPEIKEFASVDAKQRFAEICTHSRKRFESFSRSLVREPWDYFQFVDHGITQIQQSLPDAGIGEAIRDYCLHIDQQLGAVLESLSDGVILLLVSLPSPSALGETPGGFILASENNPMEGEIEGARLIDMAPTLLDLAGYDIPLAMRGRSLVAGQVVDREGDAELSEDEEAILRERLSGLGYI